VVLFFFFKQKTAYEIRLSLVGSEMCIRDRKFIESGKYPTAIFCLYLAGFLWIATIDASQPGMVHGFDGHGMMPGDHAGTDDTD